MCIILSVAWLFINYSLEARAPGSQGCYGLWTVPV